MQVREWLDPKAQPVVIVRFLGTTPKSTNIATTLFTLVNQLERTFQLELSKGLDFNEIVQRFHSLLGEATADKPIIMILDSLDQLSAANNAHRLGWLPFKVPQHAYLFLSTLPQLYGILENLRKRITDHSVIHVPQLGDDLGQTILTSWLDQQGRCLSKGQFDITKNAFKQCSLPLYVKLVYEEVVQWHSYQDKDQATLAHTVREIIEHLFERLQKTYGKVLVCHSLAYITASKTGLSLSELEDILSLDDEVLTDVFQYHTPPLRRLPPLLWLRIQHDISSYLVTRDTDGVPVIYWYHRQFIEAATDYYLSDNEMTQNIHSTLADFFLGKWHGKEKPFLYTDYQMKKLGVAGAEACADRKVAAQPLYFGTSSSGQKLYNLRKLNNLPYHLAYAPLKRQDELMSNILFNYNWLYTKLKATSIQSVLLDFQLTVIDTGQVQHMETLLRLAQSNLSTTPASLATEIVGRLLPKCNGYYKYFEKLVRGALNEGCHDCALMPRTQCYPEPGGALQFTIEHVRIPSNVAFPIMHLHRQSDTLVILTKSNSLLLWDVKSGDLLDEVELWPDPDTKINVMYSNIDDRSVILASAVHKDSNPVVVYDIVAGTITFAKELDKTYSKIGFFEHYQLALIQDKIVVNVVNAATDCYDLDGHVIKAFGFKASSMTVAANQRHILFEQHDPVTVTIVDIITLDTIGVVTLESKPVAMVTILEPNMAYIVSNQSHIIDVVSLENDISEDRKVRSHDISLTTHSAILHMSLAQNGRYLIITTTDSYLLWSTNKQKVYRKFVIPQDIKQVRSPNSKAVVNDKMSYLVGMYEHHIIVWSVVYSQLFGNIEAYKLPMNELFISLDGQLIVTATYHNRVVKVWQLDKLGEMVSTPLMMKSSCRYMQAAVDVPYFIARGYEDTHIAVYNSSTACEVSTPSSNKGSLKPIISSNGMYAVFRAYAGDEAVTVWTTDTGSQVSTIPVSTLCLKSLCCSHSGQLVVTYCDTSPTEDVELTIWNAMTGSRTKQVPLSQGGLSHMFFTSKDEYLVTLQQFPMLEDGRNCKVKVYDVKNGKQVFMKEGLTEAVYLIPKTTWVLVVESGSNPSSDSVVVIDVKSGQEKARHHMVPDTIATFDSKGELMADYKGYVIRVMTGELVANFSEHINHKQVFTTPDASSRRLSADGQFLVWLSVSEGLIKVGRVSSGLVIGECYAHTQPKCFEVMCNNTVSVGCDDGRIMILHIIDTSDSMHIDILDNVLQDYLDPQRRRERHDEHNHDDRAYARTQRTASACCIVL